MSHPLKYLLPLPVWKGGSGDLGSGWIIGYTVDSDTEKLLSIIYGAPSYSGEFLSGDI